MALPTGSIGQVVRAPKKAELIAGHIRRRIVHGELQEGDTLPPELTLMAQFGVSRPTLREAFRILETESMITVRRGSRGGAQVVAPDLSVAARYVGLLLQMQGTTIVDVYEARTAVEPICARMLAERRTDDDLKELQACVEDLRAIVEAGEDQVPDPKAWADQTFRFHDLVMQRSGNNTLAVQGGVLHDIVQTHLAVTVARGFDEPGLKRRFTRNLRSYVKLIALVEAGNGAGAEQHWREHMEVAAKSLLKDDLKSKRVVDLFS
jgi:GntR family transcriptional repressor for pyruvate dehydrogenase complex